MLSGVGTPPIGTGSYASWVVFVVVIIASVALAEIIVKTIGLTRG